MSINDPLGDMLTRIRNAQQRRRPKVVSPASNLRVRVLDVLAEEVAMRHGRAWRVEVGDDSGLVPGGQYAWRRRGEFPIPTPRGGLRDW